ncbi:MAG TPA: hypothetical protein VM733_01785 [Thermoanaerobaculia bacterium]|nr:hypothetical protein [Thermoanaerobaculia bacterium]
MGIAFDRITAMLEARLTPSIRDTVYRERFASIDGVLAQCVGARREETNALLLQAARICETDLARVCAQHSADVWLSLVRRVPPSIFEGAWTVHATLGILKYSNWSKDTTQGRVDKPGSFGVALPDVDLLDAWRIAVDAALIERMLGWRRVCSKGGSVVADRSTFRLDTPPDVEVAIDEYERRRPVEWIFGDDGVPMPLDGDVTRPILILHPLAKPVALSVPKENSTLTVAHLPVLLPFEALRRALTFYDEPLLDKYGAGAEAILQVLVGLSAQCLASFPPLDEADGHWVTGADSSDPRLKFTFDLLQRGYVRFPRAHLEKALARVEIDVLPGDTESRVRAFFDAFVLKPEQRDSIDVLSLEMPPIAWETPGGNCYFDLVMYDDFIRTLLSSARDWYSTAHGDRFNLLLKTMIEQAATRARILGAKRTITTAAGVTRVPDLLVQQGNVLYVIECKAFSKSRAFWRGDLDALRQRTARVADAVRQAREAARVVQQALADGAFTAPGVEDVQWLVCGPTQEFLLPLDRYGLLASGVSRVCTHEELLTYLARH